MATPAGTDPNNPQATALDPSTGPGLLAQLFGSTDLGQLPSLIDEGFVGQFGQRQIGSLETPADLQRLIQQAIQRQQQAAGQSLRGVGTGPAADVSRGILSTQQGLGEQEIVRRRAQSRLFGGGGRGPQIGPPQQPEAPPRSDLKPKAEPLGRARLGSIEDVAGTAGGPPPAIRALQQAIDAADVQQREQGRRQSILDTQRGAAGGGALGGSGFINPGAFESATNNLGAFALGDPSRMPFSSPEQAFQLTLGGGGVNAQKKATTLDLARSTVHAWAISRNLAQQEERERRELGAVEAFETGDAGFGQGLRGIGAAFGEEGIEILRRLNAGESADEIRGQIRGKTDRIGRAEETMKRNLQELSRRQTQASRPRAQSKSRLQSEIRKREAKLYDRVAEAFDVESLFNVDASRFGLSSQDVLSSFMSAQDAEAMLSELAGGTSASEIADRIRSKTQMQAELQRRNKINTKREEFQINRQVRGEAQAGLL